MSDVHTLLRTAYTAFNRRDIDGALALMTDDVRWPKASEGGEVFGKEEIRAYWTRQWREVDGKVEPLEIQDVGAGRVRVRVRQVVRDLQGELLSDSEVLHIFTLRGSLICAMDLTEDGTKSVGPSAAFQPRF